MSQEIAVSPVFTSLPEAPRASSDTQLLEIWLHGRSRHTQRAYRADIERFLSSTGKPFLQVTLSDLQQFRCCQLSVFTRLRPSDWLPAV